MKTTTTMIAALLLALTVATGCQQRSDAAIISEVEGNLDEAGIGGNVAVTATNGVVTLTGTAMTDDTREKAEDIAEDTGGVKKVVNNIRTTTAGDVPAAAMPLN